MDDATPPQFKRGRGRPPMLPNGLKAQKLDGGQWKDELGNIWNHREAVATARKRAVEKYSAKKKRDRAAARATQETLSPSSCSSSRCSAAAALNLVVLPTSFAGWRAGPSPPLSVAGVSGSIVVVHSEERAWPLADLTCHDAFERPWVL